MDEHVARRPPRLPRLRAPIAYGSPREVAVALAWTGVGLLAVMAAWAPIIYAGVCLYRRLHHH